jgi:hypothetical protein
MTNARQVRQIFRTFSAVDPSLKEMRVRFLLKTPVCHFSCGVFIERCSDPDRFLPSLAVSALFYAALCGEIRIGNYSEPIFRPEHSQAPCWLWSDPSSLGDAIDVIRDFALQRIDRLSTVEGYADLLIEDNRFYKEPAEDRMIVHIAHGDLEAARAIWHERQLWHAGKSFPPGTRADRWRLQLAAVEGPLMAGDRRALAKILHDWEAANVRGTELEPFWEPTPFPLEG